MFAPAVTSVAFTPGNLFHSNIPHAIHTAPVSRCRNTQMMRMTRKTARGTTVEVREARRVAVVGGGGKEVEEVGVKMGVWLFCTTRREAKTVLTRTEMLKRIEADDNQIIDR